MNFVLSCLLNLSIDLLPAGELNELCAAFFANLSVIPLPAKELMETLFRVSC